MGMTGLYYALFAVWYLVSIAAVVQLYLFTSSHGSISNFRDMKDFKDLARLQMYGALAVIVLGGSTFLLGIFLIFTDRVGLFTVILLNLAMLPFGIAAKKLENRAKSLPVTAEELKAEYRRVMDSWMNKPFPDF